MDKMTVRDIDVRSQKVLVRVDFNVPLEEKTGKIIDDSRIRAALPTIKYLIAQKAKVILMSHLGRPKGKVAEGLSLVPVAQRLAQILGQVVAVAPDCIGAEAESLVANLKSGNVLLLENLRFHAEEEAGDASFAQALARLGDVFVNDAFGAAHRPHASIVGIAGYLPAVAGFLLEKEVDTLSNLLRNPAHPFAAILSGIKISDKVSLIKNIIGKVDSLLIGGGLSATFFKAKSYEVGLSLAEDGMLDTAIRLMEETRKKGTRLLLPIDVIVASEVSEKAVGEAVAIEKIPKDKGIVDIGPKTVRLYLDELRKCQTVFWNGPVGAYEISQFAKGTYKIARFLVKLDATTIIGGGSTADIVNDMGLTDKMTFVSTGGGASLEFLSGETLPGVAALRDKKS